MCSTLLLLSNWVDGFIPLQMQVTPEILRELNNSRNRGEKGDDIMLIYILTDDG